jgi:hypothetical protein
VRPYLKFLAQVTATVLAGAYAAIAGDGIFSTEEQINCIILGLGAIGVLGAGNLPAGVWSYMKGYVAAATAVATIAISAVTDGINDAEWIQMGLAALGTVGVVGLKGPVVQLVGRHRASP